MANQQDPKTQVEARHIGPQEDLPSPDVREATEHQAAPPSPTPYPIDEVEEALLDSFPASDPPGYGTGHA